MREKSDKKMWIIESRNLNKPSTTFICTTTIQPLTNLNPQPIDEGWLGTTDNIDRDALGKYDDIFQARREIVKRVLDAGGRIRIVGSSPKSLEIAYGEWKGKGKNPDLRNYFPGGNAYFVAVVFTGERYDEVADRVVDEKGFRLLPVSKRDFDEYEASGEIPLDELWDFTYFPEASGLLSHEAGSFFFEGEALEGALNEIYNLAKPI